MKELSTTYEPHEVEDNWIVKWQEQNLFAPGPKKAGQKSFSVVIPPPNVTGSLHMGHALNNTLQDILVRYHRMKGDNTLWVVGTDHAGIATQNVVERQLTAEGKSRFDLGREKFVERVWEWKAQSGGTIINQLKRLGASCDFANERFTMDEGLSLAVKKVFVQLYNEGLIYRGLRLINWCPRCHTALSDLEVEHEEKKGSLWHIKYQIAGREDFLIVATTRPETLLGDTAVAVNPSDERYKHLIGQKVLLPLLNKEISIIADDYVDVTFGSGVVKITPAHDFNDFAVAERHQLEKINILTESALINEMGAVYQGLTVAKAREKILADLESAELIDKVEDHTNKVGHCYRCHSVVEPYLSYQWFVNAKTLAVPAIEAVRNGETRFVPQHWEKTYFNWMENIQDWCVSRQIWWGHQIPAWYCENYAEHSGCNPIVSETTPDSCNQCGSKNLRQETDVLDTWFSSALWPFSTLGWPTDTEKVKTFYPTSTLITAFDIIFFWVARMMMMGIHFMKEVPFKDIHIHALVRDPMGQKMSKSKGNVVDPLIMMHKYGTDAFRFTLTAFAAQGRDIKLDEARIEGYRNFCNKIWNATRFAMMNAAPFIKSEADFQTADPKLDALNEWIIFKLNQAIQEVSEKIENYEFNMAAHAIYKFFWNEFCDTYVEFSKEIYQLKGLASPGSAPLVPQIPSALQTVPDSWMAIPCAPLRGPLRGAGLEPPPQRLLSQAGCVDQEDLKRETAQTTYYVLDTAMRLMHPFMPFITEEIWQTLTDRSLADGSKKSIVVAAYPVSQDVSAYQKSAQGIELVSELLAAIRSTRQEIGISLAEKVKVQIILEQKSFDLMDGFQTRLQRLAKVETLLSNDMTFKNISRPSVLTKCQSGWVIFSDQDQSRIAKAKDLQEKRLKQIEKDILSLSKQVDDPNFPAELKKEKQTLLDQAKSQKQNIEIAISFIP